MRNVLALVADRREWLVMHKECAFVCPTSVYWYAADLSDPVRAMMGDRCPWCQFRLDERPDPHLEIKARA